jgi:hypothetical protein
MADDAKNEEVVAPVEEDTKEEDAAPVATDSEAPKPSLFGKLCGCFSKKPVTESKEVPPVEDKPIEPTEKTDEAPEQAQPVSVE